MEVVKISEMKNGWFIGDFEPSVFKTKDFEVCFMQHPKGSHWDRHYHEHCDEINYLIRGSMVIQGTTLKAGDIFTLRSFEVADPKYLEDCEIIVVKVPSVVGDKVIIP